MDAAHRATGTPNHEVERFALQCQGCTLQGIAWQGGGPEPAPGLFLEQVSLVTLGMPEARESHGRSGSPPFELGQDFVANPGAIAGDVAIAAIVSPGLIDAVEVATEVILGMVEEWANHAS